MLFVLPLSLSHPYAPNPGPSLHSHPSCPAGRHVGKHSGIETGMLAFFLSPNCSLIHNTANCKPWVLCRSLFLFLSLARLPVQCSGCRSASSCVGDGEKKEDTNENIKLFPPQKFTAFWHSRSGLLQKTHIYLRLAVKKSPAKTVF